MLRKCGFDFAVNTRLFDNSPDTNGCGDTWKAPPSSEDQTETRKIPANYYDSAFLQSGNCVPLNANNLPDIVSQSKRILLSILILNHLYEHLSI